MGCLIGFGAISLLCLIWTIESMARASGILQWQAAQAGVTAPPSLSSSVELHHEHHPLLHSDIGHVYPSAVTVSTANSLNGPIIPKHELGYEKMDFAVMCQLFGGAPLTFFSQACTFLYCYGVEWAYAAVFASSVDTLLFQYVFGERCNIYESPSLGCISGYYACVLVFSAVVIVLSLLDVSEQARIQQVLTGYRFVAFTTMIITAMIAYNYPNHFDAAANTAGIAPFTSPLPLANWGAFATIFSFASVALNVHYNMPDIIQPLRNKSQAHYVAIAGMSISCLYYIFIGLVCALEFG